MAEGSIGPSDHIVQRSTAVDRTRSATDRRPRRDPQDQKEAFDRRRKQPPNPRRRRVYDLLFEEIDRIDSLDERQRERVKENLRNHVGGAPPSVEPPAAPPAAEPPAPAHDDEHAAERLLADPQAEVPVDPDHIVQAAAPVHPHLPLTEAEENRILAEQLRVCLAQHTERARKLAVYLHVLLNLNSSPHPSVMLDV